jgi:hypothetical protein
MPDRRPRRSPLVTATLLLALFTAGCGRRCQTSSSLAPGPVTFRDHTGATTELPPLVEVPRPPSGAKKGAPEVTTPKDATAAPPGGVETLQDQPPLELPEGHPGIDDSCPFPGGG